MFGTHKPLVLLVDPDEEFRAETVTFLKREGVEHVVEVGNGLEALVQFKNLDPYLVILSDKMPVKNGFETCELIQSLPGGERTAILMLIEGDNYRAINRAYKSGATDFQCRPTTARMIAKRAHYMLRARHKANELHRHERRVQQAYRIANLGHWEWRISEGGFDASLEVARMLRSSRKSLRSMEHFIQRIHSEDREKVSNTHLRVVEDKAPRSVEFRIPLRNNRERILVQWVEAEQDQHGKHTRLTGFVQDVTEQRANESKIYNLAHYDPLTGLPNRGYLKQHLDVLLDQAKASNTQVAALIVDIDHFGRINSALGHSMGDELLCTIADKLSEAVQDQSLLLGDSEEIVLDDTESMALMRTDSDEFALVLSQLRSPEKAGIVAERIAQLLGEPIEIEDQTLNITASIGISVYPLDADEGYKLLECGSAALKHAKEQGRNNYQYFMQSLNQRALKRLGMESDIRMALKRDEFAVYYQPKVNLKTGKADAMEALVRWHHPSLGVVSPAEFIALAEDIGLIVELGEWVLRESCRQAKAWLDEGRRMNVAVNLSPKQFADNTHLIEVVSSTLRDTGLPADMLELELTESVFLKNTDINKNTVSILKKMGITVAIDDFGTGYSSLSYLTNFSVDTLKIDRSFVSCVAGDAQHAEVVRTIIQLAKNMKMTVVAEGIGSNSEVDFLKGAGCHYGQGYLFSPPMPAQRFLEWMDEFNAKQDTGKN